jgi:hypothetical protein
MFRAASLGSPLALFSLAFGACNSGGMVGNVGRPGTWAVVAVPTTERLTIVRGSGSNVWIAGDTTILRWDGQHWNTLPNPWGPPGSSATGLWVNAPSDVWLGAAQQYAYHWTGTAWTTTRLNDNRRAWAIWGNATNDVWAADCGVGYLGHYDGTGWNHLNSQDGGPALWGSGTSDVWLIGLLGGNSACDSAPSVIIHWQGATSVPRDTQFRFGHALQGLWGNGASELWAVGDSGAIVHYNGSGWSLIPNSPTTATLHGVWGTAAHDVWAVGDSGLILHFDGSGWSKSVSPTNRSLRSAWGGSSGDVWAVGDSGTVLHLTR